MIRDVYEPLSAYRDEFRAEFARRTREKFQSLTEQSGVDVESNRRQVRKIHKLESELGSARSRRAWFGALMALAFSGGLGAWVYTCYAYEWLEDDFIVGLMAAGVAGFALACWLLIKFNRARKRVEQLETEIAAAKKTAWGQMAALNALYTWDIPVKLIEATVPRLGFDPYFSAKRLRDLKRIYGWDDSFNDDKSILFAQSGVINGNPFLVGEYLTQDWEMKTYYGELDIDWWEMEEDSQGKPHRVLKSETLTASVEKPMPVYEKRKLVMYGNDAAPDLTFSRQPSGYDDNDLFDGIRKKWKLRELKKFSQNLEDESQYTLMANHEFETWFDTRDRNNEVQYRLLFTALAQTQLMALMKDLKTGYGDDFAFIKDHKLNYLFPRHLEDAPIDTPPERFRDWDYDRAFHNFIAFNEKYFKDIYFALAPILAIPLYQQTRTHEEIWKEVIDAEGSCFWEHEALANYYGDERFKHPDSITRSLLKTELRSRAGGVSEVAVTAHGFRGITRTDYVEVRGGDGEYHEVPVEWTEYLPVWKTTPLTLTEAEKPGDDFARNYRTSAAAVFRRNIRAYLS